MVTTEIRLIMKFLCLLVVISCIPIDARLSFRTSKSLKNIKRILGPKTNSKTNEIQKYAESNEGDKDYKEILGVIDTVGESLQGMTSGDVFEIVSGTLNVISSAASLIPVIGPIIGTVFSLLSQVFGSLGGGGGVGSIVSKEITNALNKFDDSQLKAEAHGTARVYRLSQAYLKGKESQKLKEHEVAALSANVPVYSGIKFLGILQRKILDNAIKDDKTQIKRAIEYTKLYAVLATLRSSVLWQLYSVVKGTNHSAWTANAIKDVAQSEERSDKDFIKFIVNPEYSRALFHAMFNPSEWPVITKFLNFHKLQMEQLNSNGQFFFRPEKWTTHAMMMWGDATGSMAGARKDRSGKEALFYLDPKSAQDNIFYIRSVKWPTWYVKMGNTAHGYCLGSPGKPGSSGEWKFVRYTDGKYLISPTRWLDWFIYMKNNARGDIRGWKGDPGVQGHWLIN